MLRSNLCAYRVRNASEARRYRMRKHQAVVRRNRVVIQCDVGGVLSA